MKKRALLLIVLTVLSLLSLVLSKPAECVALPSSLQWAVLIGASDNFGMWDNLETLRDTYYMYHVLKEKFGLSDDRIIYMFVNPSRATASYPSIVSRIPEGIIDVEPVNASVISQQFTELSTKTSYSDNILIYFSGHGVGWHETDGWVGGKWEPYTYDEGSEIWDIYNQWWVGCDEGLLVERYYEGETYVEKYKFPYFDDNLKSDIQKLKYNRLVLVLDCCFAGGFIDDLSNPKHTIICAAKETAYASGDQKGDTFEGFGEFTGHFLDALHGCHTTWNQSEYAQYNRLIHGETVNADLDGDGKLTWREAFKYAVAHYDSSACQPWFDDDGNGYPTFKYGKNILDYTLTIRATWGGTTNPAPGEYVYLEGTSVSVTAIPNSGYNFVHWVTDEEPWASLQRFGYYYYANPYTTTMNADRSIVACFEPPGGAGGGGSDPCPTLLVWNGGGYVDYGVINIHNPSGEDVVKEVTVQTGDVGITNYEAKFRLREGWLGLTYSHSEIDQVKLYAIDSYGNHLPCPLTKATYINQYDVWLPLLASDNNKWDIYLLDTIDLEFFVSYQNIQSFTFTIEGCNMFKE